MEKQTFYLISDRVRSNAIAALRDAEDEAIISLSPRKRTDSQNAFLHAVLTDLARSHVAWAGKRRSLEEWKMLIVSGHAVATNNPGEVIPGLEGEFVAIRESTALMGVKRAASLLEYLIAFCVQNGVELRETRKGGFLSYPGSSLPGSHGGRPLPAVNVPAGASVSSGTSSCRTEELIGGGNATA